MSESPDRRGPESQSDLPIVLQIPPRYSLSLAWLESAEAEEPETEEISTLQSSARDLDQLQKAAGRIKNAPDAVVQTLSLALTTKTQAQFEIADERGHVAGIHRDSDEATSPYNFLINHTWSGIKFSAQLQPVEMGVAAALTLRLADPPHYGDALGKLPSLRASSTATGAGSVETEAKEYHFQLAGQDSADFAATQELRPDQTWILPLRWMTTGIAVAPNSPLRVAAVSLKEVSVPNAPPAPQGGTPSAPAHP